MILKCNIHGKEYEVVQGATFSEEYNETLDSGTIIIDQVEKIQDLRPYDDVFIYEDSVDFIGYKNYGASKIFNAIVEKQGSGSYASFSFKIPKEVRTLFLTGEYSASVKVYFKGYVNKTIVYLEDDENYTEAFNSISSGELLKDETSSHVEYVKIKTDIQVENLLIDVFEKWAQNTTFEFTSEEGDYLKTISYPSTVIMEAHSYGSTTISGYIDSVEMSIELTKKMDQGALYEGKFYKHLLVDQYSEERLNPIKNIFKYKIELFSETKKLETIPLPNITITQPLKEEDKKSIWEYLKNFVERYSPKMKIKSDLYTEGVVQWDYQQKYTLDEETLKPVFESTYSPDFSLNTPNLRDILTQLMQVKDRIPYVKDDVIYAMNITERKEEPDYEFNYDGITSITSSLSSDNFCDNLKRNYTDALSEDKSGRFIEHLGFRNSDEALLTVVNMRLETRYPIYKVNRAYLCYYKRMRLVPKDTMSDFEPKDFVFICKQDITDLVLLEKTRNLLSNNWKDFKEITSSPGGDIGADITIKDISKYKMGTVGYSIGSNIISGWGTMYEYPDDDQRTYWWKQKASYIQNIITFMDNKYPFGIYNQKILLEKLEGIDDGFNADDYYVNTAYYDVFASTSEYEAMIVPKKSQNSNNITSYENSDIISEQLKSIFFEIDYSSFYNGAVIHSKDNARDDIMVNDNASSSLSILEQEGVFQKAKANRFGNKTFTIWAKYGGTNIDYESMNQLGQVYKENIVYNGDDHYGDDDVIIFHREYAVFNNYILTTYYGSRSAVLKNYFYNVFAKHRNWRLMSYEESVNRAENGKYYILLAKNKLFNDLKNDNGIDEDDVNKMSLKNFNDYNDLYSSPALNFLDFFIDTPKASIKGNIEKESDINRGIIKIKDSDNNNKYYLSDINAFSCGFSLCFNIKMFDNVSGGIYISDLSPDAKFVVATKQGVEDDYTGSQQDHYIISDENGFIKNMSFIAFHDKLINSNSIMAIEEGSVLDDQELLQAINTSYTKLYEYPKFNFAKENCSNIIEWNNDFYKDNKEYIDTTFQFEVSSNDENVIVSPWFVRLSNLLSSYNKISKTYYALENETINNICDFSIFYKYTRFVPWEYNVPLKGLQGPNFKINISNTVAAFFEDSENWEEGTDGFFNINSQIVFDFSKNKVASAFYHIGSYMTFSSVYNFNKIKFVKEENTQSAYIIIDGTISSSEGIMKIGGGFKKVYTHDNNFIIKLKHINTTASGIREYSFGEYTGIVLEGDDSGVDAYYDDIGEQHMYNQIFKHKPFYFDIGEELGTDFIVSKKVGLPQAGANMIEYYPYPKNLFISYGNNDISKNIIYDKTNVIENDINDLEGCEDITISSLLTFDKDEEGRNYINVDLEPLQDYSSEIKNLSFWYYLNDDSNKQYYSEENFSSHKTKVENIVLVADPLDSGYKYIYNTTIEPNIYNVFARITNNPNVIIKDFSYSKETGELNIVLFSEDPATGVEMIIYKNDYSEKLINGSYNFIMGINITDEDWEAGEIKIYFSMLKTRDERVYNLNRVQIGEIYNYVGKELPEPFGLRRLAKLKEQ